MADTIEVETAEVSVRYQGLARRLGWAATLCGVAPCMLGLAMPSRLEPVGSVLLAVLACAPLIAIAAAITGWVGTRRPGRIRIERNVLRLLYGTKERAIPLTDIVHGWYVPGYPARVEWSLRNGTVIRAAITEAHDADALLTASGVDVKKRTVSMRLGTGPGLFALGALGFVLSVCPSTIIAAMFEHSMGRFGEARGAIWLAVVVAGIAASIALFGPPRLTIGADGISIHRRFGARFIPYTEIEVVKNDPLEIILFFYGNQRQVRIPVAELPLEQRRALYTRIEESRRATRVRVDPAASVEMLDRNDRPLAEWRATLANLLRSREGYRVAAMHRDDVVRVLMDPTAPAERRIGAALALTSERPDDGVAQVRVAAEACASDPLRVALQRVADNAFEAADLAEAVTPDERRRRG